MAHTYKFAVARLTSNDARDERLNVGIVILAGDNVDIRASKRLDKVHAMSAALDGDQVRELLENIRALDGKLRDTGSATAETRLSMLFRGGPIALSESGSFELTDEAEYEGRVAALMRTLVDPEPGRPKIHEKRSKLLTEVKIAFRRERVLAQPGENIDSHRLVPRFEIDEGLTADLVLRNGAMHVIETVDASGDREPARRAIADIGVAALVFERARMKFGEKDTKARLVYNASATLERVAQPSLKAAEHQGASLINWASLDDRGKFVDSLMGLAIPVPKKRKGRAVLADFGRLEGLFG